ncbi:GNAT family N-acetyltransferase [Pseudotabrizicola algicola]|uniref:GNAT family N-acetyltransferase n=1 Tax=Pseudotabrizicola algicola TaxID=2709381 RepID=UPI001F083D21|nr:GNAT family N-acetyltransferase [Pseudotabrizicola algicola]
MSTDPAIRSETSGGKGRYVLSKDGHEAELTVSFTTPTLMIADHTHVPEALRGTGVAVTLVHFMVYDARARGIKIVPLCPFVNAIRKKHPEWADVFAT